MRTDQELLLLLSDDDEGAFNELYNRYWKLAYQTAFNLLEEEDACRDVVQDVFIWLWQNRTVIRVRSLKAYLMTAIRFKILNVIRTGKIKEKALSKIIVGETYLPVTDLLLEVKELQAMIDDFTNRLPAQAKKIFYLSRNEHLSHKEIAEKLNIKESTVKNQINSTLKKLRLSLNRLHFRLLFIFL